MGDNLMWLINHKFEGRKIIFWGSNSHIFKNYPEIGIYNKYSGNRDTTNTGTYIHEFLGEDLYILGFTSYNGKAGRLYSETYNIDEPPRNHFESWIYDTGLPYAFVNFANSPFIGETERKFFMKTITHKHSYVNWFNLYDGLFYIEKMYSCEHTNDEL